MRRNSNPNTFYDDSNVYYFGVDGGRQDAPVLVMKNQEVVPLENPYHLEKSNEIGLFQNGDDIFANAVGDRLKSKVKKVGGQISNAVKDTIKNPSKAIKNLGAEVKKGASKVADKGKEILNKGVGATKKVYLAIPRQAFLGLVAMNFQGLATRFLNKTTASKNTILDKWEKWGGDRGSLEGSANTGGKKKPLFISKKKRAGFVAKNVSFDGDFKYPTGLEETASLIATATPIIVAFVPLLKKEPSIDPKIDADIDAGETEEDNKDGALTQEELNAQKDLIKKQMDDIRNNPNLSPQEKEELLKQLEDVSGETFFSKYKWYLVGGTIILLGIVGYFAYKNKQE